MAIEDSARCPERREVADHRSVCVALPQRRPAGLSGHGRRNGPVCEQGPTARESPRAAEAARARAPSGRSGAWRLEGGPHGSETKAARAREPRERRPASFERRFACSGGARAWGAARGRLRHGRLVGERAGQGVDDLATSPRRSLGHGASEAGPLEALELGEEAVPLGLAVAARRLLGAQHEAERRGLRRPGASR